MNELSNEFRNNILYHAGEIAPLAFKEYMNNRTETERISEYFKRCFNLKCGNDMDSQLVCFQVRETQLEAIDTLGKQIRAKRIELGLSVSKMNTLLNCGYTNLMRYEKDIVLPTYPKIIEIGLKLGYTKLDLNTGLYEK